MHLRFNWQALQQYTGNDVFDICTIRYNEEYEIITIMMLKFRSQSEDSTKHNKSEHTSQLFCHKIHKMQQGLNRKLVVLELAANTVE